MEHLPGYCQGMNYVAGLKNDQVQRNLVSVKESHLKVALPLRAFSSPGRSTADKVEIVEKWLVCLYIDVLPIQTTLRIWDCLLYEGHKVIFRVALALFGIRSERVRESKNLPDFVDALNHFHQDKRVVNCHHFMSVSNYSVNKSLLFIIL